MIENAWRVVYLDRYGRGVAASTLISDLRQGVANLEFSLRLAGTAKAPYGPTQRDWALMKLTYDTAVEHIGRASAVADWLSNPANKHENGDEWVRMQNIILALQGAERALNRIITQLVDLAKGDSRAVLEGRIPTFRRALDIDYVFAVAGLDEAARTLCLSK